MKFIGLMLLGVLILSACGRNNNIEIVDEFDFSRLVYEEQVLTVAAMVDCPWFRSNISGVFNRAGQMLRSDLAEYGIDFRLELVTISPQAIDDHFIQKRTQFMAGMGPDVFMVLDNQLMPFAQAGFLADIYQLIYHDPAVSLEDFYENVLEAFEFDGQLMAIPMLFSVHMIGINSSLPASAIERFTQHSSITVQEMAQIYSDVMATYEGFGHLLFSQMIYSDAIIRHELGNYMNVAEREADLDIQEFAGFLETVLPAIDIYTTSFGLHVPYVQCAAMAEGFFFSSKFVSRNLAQVLMETEEQHFLNYIPLVAEDGSAILASTSWSQLLINPSLFAIRDGENRVLAWEFLKRLIEAYASAEADRSPVIGTASLETPILRRLFVGRARRQLQDAFSDNPLWSPAGIGLRFIAHGDEEAERAAINNAIDRLRQYNEMPMTIPPMIPASLFEESINQFSRGLITAEAAAHQINNRLWLWLNE